MAQYPFGHLCTQMAQYPNGTVPNCPSSVVLYFHILFSLFLFFLFFSAAKCILSVAYHANVPTSINVPRSMLEKHEFVPKSKKYEYYIYIYIYALTYILKVQPLYYEYFISNYSLKVKNTNLYLVDSHHHIHPP